MTPSTARIDLPLEATVPAVARRLTTTLLQAWGVHGADALDSCALVVCELTTNAVRHSGAGEHVELQVALHRGVARIALADGSAVVPRVREARPEDESGRGIALVEALSLRWGVEDHAGGKRVWADVAVEPVER